MSEQKYIKGIFIKDPHENAPDFVLAQVSIRREETINSLSQMTDDWVNLDVLKSREGEVYGKLNTWKKDQSEGNQNNTGSVQNSVENDVEDQEIDYPEGEITLEDIPF